MSMIKDIRKMYPDVMTEYMILKNPVGSTYVAIPSVDNNPDAQARLKFLREFITFVLTSSMLNPITREYIIHGALTVEETAQWFNKGKPLNEQKTVKNCQTIVSYGSRTLNKLFPDEEMIQKVCRRASNHPKEGYDLNVYNTWLRGAINKYSPKSELLYGIALDIPRNIIEPTITDDDYNTLLETLSPYIKSKMHKIETTINPKWFGYLNYLVQYPMLNAIDTARLEQLKRLVGSNTIL